MVINIPESRVDVQLFIQINTIIFTQKKEAFASLKPVSDHKWAKLAPKDEPSPFGHLACASLCSLADRTPLIYASVAGTLAPFESKAMS